MRTQALVLAHPVCVRVKMVAVNSEGLNALKLNTERGGGREGEFIESDYTCMYSETFL